MPFQEKLKAGKSPKKPPKAHKNKNQQTLLVSVKVQSDLVREGKQEVCSKKRKNGGQDVKEISMNKVQCLKVVLNEGLPLPMRIMSWNCQGLGRPQDLRVQHLREMHQHNFLDIFF